MNRIFPCQSCSRERALLNVWALTILPILVVFPRTTGWISAPIIIWGVCIAIKHRMFLSADWFFLAICLILPLSILFNMPFMGWDLKALARPNHLVAGFFIYLVIGRYGLRRNVLFWGACAATLIALCRNKHWHKSSNIIVCDSSKRDTLSWASQHHSFAVSQPQVLSA